MNRFFKVDSKSQSVNFSFVRVKNFLDATHIAYREEGYALKIVSFQFIPGPISKVGSIVLSSTKYDLNTTEEIDTEENKTPKNFSILVNLPVDRILELDLCAISQTVEDPYVCIKMDPESAKNLLYVLGAFTAAQCQVTNSKNFEEFAYSSLERGIGFNFTESIKVAREIDNKEEILKPLVLKELN